MGIHNLLYGSVARKINLFCLLAAILSVLIFPLKKEVWYDETISILCAKGISHDSHLMFATSDTVSSTTISALNTAKNVHQATVIDNGNSFLYNEGLHWFTGLAGNSMFSYTLFTKLAGIGVLIALYLLAELFLGNSIFTSLAIVLLAINTNYASIGAEVRAYMLATFFITLAGINFYKYMYREDRTQYLLWMGVFSAAAVLCHFLSVYIVLVFVGYLVRHKFRKLLSSSSLLAIAVPVVVIGIYFLFSYRGLATMSSQNANIQRAVPKEGFSIAEVFFRSLHLSALDFDSVFSAFRKVRVVIVFSFLCVIVLYIAAVISATERTDRRNLHLLFLLGFSSTAFLAFLSVNSHHYTALYLRYHSFCLPYGALFTAYALSVLAKNGRLKPALKLGAVGFFLIPALVLFAVLIGNGNATRIYNHYTVAQQIQKDHVATLGVPGWRDAFLVNAFLPAGYKIDYVRKENDHLFTLYKSGREETVPVLNQQP